MLEDKFYYTRIQRVRIYMRKLEWCVSATLPCVEQDRRRVLFLTGQEISRSKNNTVIPQYCTGSNMYLQVERKKWCKIRMFNQDE